MITQTPTRPHFSILATSFAGGPRPRNAAAILAGLWLLIFFVSLFAPPLLDDADATHAQAAQAIASTGDLVTLHVDGVRYLEKAPLPYWLAALCFRLFGFNTFAAHLPQALAVAALALLGHRWANQAFGARTGFYTAIALLTSTGIFLFTRILIPDVLLSLFLAAALFAFLKSLTPDPSSPEALGAPFIAQPHRAMSGSTPEVLPPERPSIAWYAGPHFYPYVMASSLACAVLTKGLVALVLFLIPAALFLTLTSTWANVRRLKPLTSTLLFLAIAAPWHILAALRNPATATHPGWAWFYLWNEHVLRFLGRRIPRDYNKLPGYAFWLQHLAWLFPWSLFLPLAVTALWRRSQHQVQVLTKPYGTQHPLRSVSSTFIWALPVFAAAAGFYILSTALVDKAEAFALVLVGEFSLSIMVRRRRVGLTASPFHRIDPQQRSILLLALFAAVTLLFFSLSTNQEYYTLPAYLPILLLIAATITRAEQTFPTSPSSRRWIAFAHISLSALGALTALALAWGLFASRHLPFNPDIGTLLAHRSVGDYTLSTSHLFDLTTSAFAALRLPAILAAVAFLLGPALAQTLRTQRRHIAATTTIAFTAAAFLFSAHLALIRFAPLLSSQQFAATIQHLERTGTIAPDTQILILGDQAFGSSIPFYLGTQHRLVYLVDGRSTSMLFGSTFPDAPPIFLTPSDLLARWGQGPRKILFIPPDRRPQATQLLSGLPQFILQQSSGKLLLTDRPLGTPSKPAKLEAAATPASLKGTASAVP